MLQWFCVFKSMFPTVYFLNLLYFLSMALPQHCNSENNLSEHLQLLLVTSPGWENIQGTLQCFERASKNEEWTSIGQPNPVVLGKSGMAWGVGICKLNNHPLASKVEGDLKSPAGFFSLGCAFGFISKSQLPDLKMVYQQLNEFIVAVDDPQSIFYNCIVDSRDVIPDWNSSEKMAEEPLYEKGLVINHNFPSQESGRGSAIFFHRWRNSDSGTAGCTAMSQNSLDFILFWVDKNKNPLLIQLPYPIYSQLQSTWNLPNLNHDAN